MLYTLRIFICGLALFFSALSLASKDSVYLQNGEVWFISENGNKQQLTQTEGHIAKIDKSPSGNYIAAHKIIGYIEFQKDLENPKEFFKDPYLSVLIIDVKSSKVIKELKSEKRLLHPLNWLNDSIYIFGEGSFLDISMEFHFDVKTGKTIRNDN